MRLAARRPRAAADRGARAADAAALVRAHLPHPRVRLLSWFLDRIATHILAFEGDSQVAFFQGSYSEYAEDKRKRLGAQAGPSRLKYRPLAALK